MRDRTIDISVEARAGSPLFEKLRLTVECMLRVIENPASTPLDQRRACSTIRDAFDASGDANQYGLDLAACEHTAAANDPSSDCRVAELDSQEKAFAEKLRELMKARAITQVELASRIGCTQPAISQMLKRQCRPQRRTILALADALNVSPRDLWEDLEVMDILDTVAAAQDEQQMSHLEADAIRRALARPPADAPAASLPRRKQ